jgi:Ca2+-binding RTX toxin-like protein
MPAEAVQHGTQEEPMAIISGDGLLTGTPGNDTIDGGSGDDTLRGEDGNDVLRGHAGSDFLEGGNGNDRLVGGAGVDFIDGGDIAPAGTDTAVFDGVRADYVFEPADVGPTASYLKVTNTANGTFDYVVFVDKFQFADMTISASDIPSVFDLKGSYLSETINGTAASDTLFGGFGDDRLIGGAGIDFIDGGPGTDTAVFDGVRANYVFEPAHIGGSPGYLKVTNTADGTFDYVLFVENFQFADKTISASAIPSVFNLTGSYLNETINGTSGNDQLQGSFGNDILNGFAGNDTLYGGSDAFYHDDGSSGNDTLNGGAGNDYFDGSDGDDIYNGGEGMDRTVLIMQHDVAANFSLAANPTLVTALGSKTLNSIQGADVEGSSLADRITGGSAHDFLYGGHGNDRLDGAGGDDFLDGDYDDDVLYGGGGNDIIFGGASGNDKLYGGSGNDRLIGYDGNDLLVGGPGTDLLNGGDGSDTLTGSDGADIFIFSDSALGTTRTGEHDVVTDFVNGTDKIDLSAVYDSHAIGAISAGSAAQGEAVTDFGLVYNQSGTRTFVYGDTDGVAGADFVIELLGSIKIAAGNLITTEAQWTTATGLDYNSADNDEGMLHQDQAAPYYWYFALGFDA